MGMMLLFAGMSSAQDVKTDVTISNTNFTQYKSYSWGQIKTQDPLMVDRIKSAVNSALAAKGLRKFRQVSGTSPSWPWRLPRISRRSTRFTNGFGGGWRWGGFGDATTTPDTYKVGTLVVDLFDANTKKLEWRGSASDTLSNKSGKEHRQSR